MLIWTFHWLTCFTRKILASKSCSNEIFEYSLLGKELRALSDIAKKQYQKLGDAFEFD